MRIVLVAIISVASTLFAPSALAERPGGETCAFGTDVTPRFFHRASALTQDVVLVSGGMRLQLFPQTLVSLSAVSFVDVDAGTVSSTFQPSGGGNPVTVDLAIPRSSHTQTTLADGRVLFTGGRTGAAGTSPGTPVDSVELFDPVTGLVTAGPAMSAARAGHSATRLGDGRIVVAGGSTWQVLDAAATTWSPPHALVNTRADHAAVLLSEGVLLVGGAGTGGATMEVLDPDGPVSALRASRLGTAVDDLAATRLDDGTVLIVGGQDLASGDTIADTWIYDPARDTLTSVPPPPERVAGISDHQLIGTGRLAFVFGGEQQVSGTDLELDYAAVYDRAAGDWHPLDPMGAAHDDFGAVPLPDGTIVLVDGAAPFLGQGVPTDTVELFTPTTLRPRDLNGDGDVGFADVLLLIAGWGPCPAGAWCALDVDGSGDVGFGDVLRLIAVWGGCP